MKIYDSDGDILAFKIDVKKIKKGKNFVTNNNDEFQVASFLLNKSEKIERHYHPDQNRSLSKTSEVLVLIEGKLKVSIYDKKNKFVDSLTIESGDTIALVSGGHELEILEESKFIEVKQGPYNEKTDKVRF